MKNITIRQENPNDYNTINDLLIKAFATLEESDHLEHLLVKRLRTSNAYIPALALVAECNNIIVGHIVFTQLTIGDNHQHRALALAPVCTLPEYQKNGIGSALINHGLNLAKELKFDSVIVMGHQDYYPKFGFTPAARYSISAPFSIPDELFMVLELAANSLENITGCVHYATEFFA